MYDIKLLATLYFKISKHSFEAGVTISFLLIILSARILTFLHRYIFLKEIRS